VAERITCVEAVLLSDSFHAALGPLVAELGGRLETRAPDAGRAAPGVAAVLILAGGMEAEALELLPSLVGMGTTAYLIGAAADHRIAVAAVRSGARDYFALPEDLDLLRRSLERDLRGAGGRDKAVEFAARERRESGFAAIVGNSDTLREVLAQAARVAALRDVTVLLGGETGTGKELLARAIHYASPRATEPFVEVNCAAIPALLLESELFGHEKGAFTGAVAAKPGLFEQAHGGTLFLDEIGQLPIELQAKLLRALENREIRRVGGTSIRTVDVRVVAATHVELAEAVRRKEFREDLYYRLNVVRLVLPPLRERGSDVELLAETFASRLAATHGLAVPALGSDVRQLLRGHSWPGNVRELRNAIERALVLSPPGTLSASALGLARGNGPSQAGVLPFPAELATITLAAVRAMLEGCGGNKSEAARRLGISRPRLQRVLDHQDE